MSEPRCETCQYWHRYVGNYFPEGYGRCLALNDLGDPAFGVGQEGLGGDISTQPDFCCNQHKKREEAAYEPPKGVS